MNHLLDLSKLSNRYVVMRHGQSQANQQGIIVSHPHNGIVQYGLTEAGREQVIASLRRDHPLDAETRIISSDFKRARETAQLVRRSLHCKHAVTLEPRLRERGFGELELGGDEAYAGVWRQDAASPQTVYRGVETVDQVMARVTALIADFERQLSAASILLVSHGDALQILQTGFAGEAASTHRQRDHLRTAEIRLLKPAWKN